MRRPPRSTDAALLLLRARTRPLLRRLSPAARRLVRAVPALLEGIFHAAPFDGDPPGVEGRHASRAARALAVREAGPVVGWSRGRRAITALFLVRTADGVGLEALCAEGAEGQRSLTKRLARIDTLLRAQGLAGIRAHTQLPEALAERLAFAGGLIAGVLTPAVSKALLGALDGEVEASAVPRLLPLAATPLGRVALILGPGGRGPGPALRRCAARGLPLLAADPELGFLAWCAERGEPGPLQLLAQISPHAPERLWATDLLHAFAAPRGAEALTLGRTLALGALRRVRSHRRELRDELWGGGVPHLLRGARLELPLRASPTAQQRLRDDSLRERLSGAAPRILRRTLQLRLETGAGPALLATAVLLRPGFQPSSRRLSGVAVHQALVKEALAGAELSVVGATGALEPLAAALQRTAIALQQLSASGPAPALHIRGQVHFQSGGQVRTLTRQRFAARPRRAALIDFDGAARSSEEESGLLPTLRCEVTQVEPGRVALSYRGRGGQLFEERVEEPQLERWLGETASLLRAAPAPTLLSVRRPAAPRSPAYEPELETAIELELDADRRLRLVIAGERFGGASELGWRAAAQTLLSTWPPQARARVVVGAVRSVWPLQPLELLYARSVAVRRLTAQVRMCRP